MIIYHGSKKEIAKPIQGGSDAHNDYGPSFYLTLDLDEAQSWACKNDTIGLVNKYVVDSRAFSSFKILDLSDI